MRATLCILFVIFGYTASAQVVKYQEKNGFVKIVESRGSKIYKFGGDAEKVTYIKGSEIISIVIETIADGKPYIVIGTTELVANGHANENKVYKIPVDDIQKAARKMETLLSQIRSVAFQR